MRTKLLSLSLWAVLCWTASAGQPGAGSTARPAEPVDPAGRLLRAYDAFQRGQITTENDPSDWFLEAYTQFMDGERQESKGSGPSALRLYRDAAAILDVLSFRWPKWNRSVVHHRYTRTLEAIVRLEQSPPLPPRDLRSELEGLAIEPIPIGPPPRETEAERSDRIQELARLEEVNREAQARAEEVERLLQELKKERSEASLSARHHKAKPKSLGPTPPKR